MIRVCSVFLVVAALAVSPRSLAPATKPASSALDAIKASYRRPASVRDTSGAVQKDPRWILGQRLFFEPRLSASGTLACGGCHKPDLGWSDHRPKAQGEGPAPLAFRSPTLIDAGLQERYGWIGRFSDIEAVAFFAMTSAANMNIKPETLVARLNADPTYVTAFKAAFPDGEITKHTIGSALDLFVGSIISDAAPFDRWVAGDANAIDDSAKRGFVIFNGKAKCAACHSGWTFTDGSFHDVGTGTGDDIGRGKLFKTSMKLQYAFKTPTLRNVMGRAPYMHDGSLATLSDVVDHYDKGGIARPSRAESIEPLHLSEGDKADLIAFLQTLTGRSDYAKIDR